MRRESIQAAISVLVHEVQIFYPTIPSQVNLLLHLISQESEMGPEHFQCLRIDTMCAQLSTDNVFQVLLINHTAPRRRESIEKGSLEVSQLVQLMHDIAGADWLDQYQIKLNTEVAHDKLFSAYDNFCSEFLCTSNILNQKAPCAVLQISHALMSSFVSLMLQRFSSKDLKKIHLVPASRVAFLRSLQDKLIELAKSTNKPSIVILFLAYLRMVVQFISQVLDATDFQQALRSLSPFGSALDEKDDYMQLLQNTMNHPLFDTILHPLISSLCLWGDSFTSPITLLLMQPFKLLSSKLLHCIRVAYTALDAATPHFHLQGRHESGLFDQSSTQLQSQNRQQPQLTALVDMTGVWNVVFHPIEGTEDSAITCVLKLQQDRRGSIIGSCTTNIAKESNSQVIAGYVQGLSVKLVKIEQSNSRVSHALEVQLSGSSPYSGCWMNEQGHTGKAVWEIKEASCANVPTPTLSLFQLSSALAYLMGKLCHNLITNDKGVHIFPKRSQAEESNDQSKLEKQLNDETMAWCSAELFSGGLSHAELQPNFSNLLREYQDTHRQVSNLVCSFMTQQEAALSAISTCDSINTDSTSDDGNRLLLLNIRLSAIHGQTASGNDQNAQESTFYSNLLSDTGSACALNKWVEKHAGSSLITRSVGDTLFAAKRAVIGAMIRHTGNIEDAIAIAEQLEQEGVPESEDLKPPKSLILIWQAGQRIVEWAMRRKGETGTTANAIAALIIKHAQFLLELEPAQSSTVEAITAMTSSALGGTASRKPNWTMGLVYDPEETKGVAKEVEINSEGSGDNASGVTQWHRLRVMLRALQQWKKSKIPKQKNKKEKETRSISAQSRIVAQITKFIQSNPDTKSLRREFHRAATRALFRSVGFAAFHSFISLSLGDSKDGLSSANTSKESVQIEEPLAIHASLMHHSTSLLEWLPIALRKTSETNQEFKTNSNRTPQGHYLNDLAGAGHASIFTVRSSFRNLFSSLCHQLDNACVDLTQSFSLLLTLLDAWGLVVAPEDHSFLADSGIFRILQEIIHRSNALWLLDPPILEVLQDRIEIKDIEEKVENEKKDQKEEEEEVEVLQPKAEPIIDSQQESDVSNQVDNETTVQQESVLENTQSLEQGHQLPIQQNQCEQQSEQEASMELRSNIEASEKAEQEQGVVEQIKADESVEKSHNESKKDHIAVLQRSLLHSCLLDWQSDIQRTVTRAALNVVHLLASQVAQGDVQAQEEEAGESIISPDILDRSTAVWDQPSGPEVLGHTVFEILYEELSSACSAMVSSRLSQARGESKSESRKSTNQENELSTHTEDFTRQVLFLLYCVSGTPVCQKHLVSTRWLKLLVRVLACGTQRMRRRTLRLFRRLLPSTNPHQIDLSLHDDLFREHIDIPSEFAALQASQSTSVNGLGLVSHLIDIVASMVPSALKALISNQHTCGVDTCLKFLPGCLGLFVEDAQSTSAESVMLLRTLLSVPCWNEIFSHLSVHYVNEWIAIDPCGAQDEQDEKSQDNQQNEEKTQVLTARVIAVLAVLGGHYEDLRVGGNVIRIDKPSASFVMAAHPPEGLLIEYSALSDKARVVWRPSFQNRNSHQQRLEEVVSVDQISAIPELPVDPAQIPLDLVSLVLSRMLPKVVDLCTHSNDTKTTFRPAEIGLIVLHTMRCATVLLDNTGVLVALHNSTELTNTLQALLRIAVSPSGVFLSPHDVECPTRELLSSWKAWYSSSRAHFMSKKENNVDVKSNVDTEFEDLDPRVRNIIDMGFPKHWCERAIQQADTIENALTWILSNEQTLQKEDQDHEALSLQQSVESCQNVQENGDEQNPTMYNEEAGLEVHVEEHFDPASEGQWDEYALDQADEGNIDISELSPSDSSRFFPRENNQVPYTSPQSRVSLDSKYSVMATTNIQDSINRYSFVIAQFHAQNAFFSLLAHWPKKEIGPFSLEHIGVPNSLTLCKSEATSEQKMQREVILQFISLLKLLCWMHNVSINKGYWVTSQSVCSIGFDILLLNEAVHDALSNSSQILRHHLLHIMRKELKYVFFFPFLLLLFSFFFLVCFPI